jgi:CHASE2 domain-containing sensor protein
LRDSGFDRHWLTHTAIAVVALTMLSTIFYSFGWFSAFETASLDLALRNARFTEVDDVRLVEITDEDYSSEKLFDSRSPLEPEKVADLIDTIRRGDPLVIVVDLLVDPEGFELHDGADDVPIVWAQAGKFEDNRLVSLRNAVPGPLSGVAAFPVDSDGAIRRYQRRFEIDGRYEDSLPWAAVRAICARLAASGDNDRYAGCQATNGTQAEDEILLNFSALSYGFPRISASNLIAASTGAGEQWSSNGPLTGRIVVLGGTYWQARDTYVTAIGVVNGVDLISHTIATELLGRGQSKVSKILLIAVELICGFAIATIHRLRMSIRSATVLSLVMVPFVAIIASFIVFSKFSLWMTFAPVLVGTLIHQLYELTHKLDEQEKAQRIELKQD